MNMTRERVDKQGLLAEEKGLYLFLLVLFCSVMIWAYGRTDPATQVPDVIAYRTMANAVPGLDASVLPPFAYRILGPYIVGLLPLPDSVGFYLLAVIFSFALTIVYSFFLVRLGIKPPVAAFTTCLFITNKYFFGLPIWQYFQVNDVLSLIELVVLFWAMLERKWLLFGFTMALGALTRETPLVMVPVTLVYLLENGRLKTDVRQLLFASIPGVILFALARMFIPTAYHFDYFTAFGGYVRKFETPETWFRLLINSFAPFSLLPIIFSRFTVIFFRENMHMLLYVALVLMSTSFGSNNERLMAPAFVVFYYLLARIIQDFFWRHRFAVGLVFIAALLSSLHHVYGVYPVPRTLVIVFSLLSLTAVTVIGTVIKLREVRVDAG